MHSHLTSQYINTTLTFREKEVLLLRTKGYSRMQISSSLNISEFTVKTHLQNIHRKLEVSTQVELIQLVIKADKS